ncbi:MAG: hypothetical protein AB7V16_13695 [Vulcanibacillus sp.]
MFIIFYSQLEVITNGQTIFLFFCLGIISIVYYLLSDVLFLGISLRIRIYRIKIFRKSTISGMDHIYSLIYRRFLEVTIHPMMVRSFLSRSQVIDKMTETYISESEKMNQ